MSLGSNLRRARDLLAQGVDDVAAVMQGLGRALRPVRRVQIVEQADGGLHFFLLNPKAAPTPLGQTKGFSEGGLRDPAPKLAKAVEGSLLEVVLSPRHFIFRQLELPKRAEDFLDGIVRAQIDRLTPWTAADAAFGWSAPTPLSQDRIALAVAATSKAQIASIANAIAALRPDACVMATTQEGTSVGAGAIRLSSFGVGAGGASARLRAAVVGSAAIAALLALGSVTAWDIWGGELTHQRHDLQRRIAMRRVELMSGRASLADEEATQLDKRKRAIPASVIVLDSLSSALPDDTFLTELHVENGKLQVSGLTRDAPSLIRIIEQTPQFTRATFYAPTTRSPNENGDRFHIEAHIEPYFPTATQ